MRCDREVHRRRQAFTLVELLVVVAIIAVLMALLLPSLAAARDQAKALKCASNMRTMGQGLMLFASEHEDRCPGDAYDTGNNTGANWSDMINVEVFQTQSFWPNKSDRSPYIPLNSQNARSPGALLCPKFLPPNVYPQNSFWWISYSLDAKGGANWAPNPPCGPYGMDLDPAVPNHIYSAGANAVYQGKAVSPFNIFHLGAKLSKFNPYMMVIAESDSVNQKLWYRASTSWAKATPFEQYSSYTGPYTYAGGLYAFRHPNGRAGNFLFFDGRVDRMAPAKDLYTQQRLMLE